MVMASGRFWDMVMGSGRFLEIVLVKGRVPQERLAPLVNVVIQGLPVLLENKVCQDPLGKKVQREILVLLVLLERMVLPASEDSLVNVVSQDPWGIVLTGTQRDQNELNPVLCSHGKVNKSTRMGLQVIGVRLGRQDRLDSLGDLGLKVPQALLVKRGPPVRKDLRDQQVVMESRVPLVSQVQLAHRDHQGKMETRVKLVSQDRKAAKVTKVNRKQQHLAPLFSKCIPDSIGILLMPFEEGSTWSIRTSRPHWTTWTSCEYHIIAWHSYMVQMGSLVREVNKVSLARKVMKAQGVSMVLLVQLVF
eukprot:g47309.t1